ncbi:ribonuclease HII [Patescibacteria group bacterium]|nr:ribonuclease HII [Patescibacteria group bacterium]MBU4512183.1 ribonuclease HII [Patescibacteria group bacterium]MCG2693467.1 ribonuclease HII [Candidatus Parcubacteria bacterium]
MILPTLLREKKLWEQGYENIVGLDEVGRGPWAGPLLAAGVVVHRNQASSVNRQAIFKYVRDSKLLSWRQREMIYNELSSCDWLDWAVGIVEVAEVDTLGIGEASRLAMRRAIGQLSLRPDFLLIDAVKLPEYTRQSESIIKGDVQVFSIACASIIAKVIRDNMMRELAQKYPYWGFDKHKGYGTAFHSAMIEKYGVSEAHRKSFRPIKRVLKLE